ncbi:MAG: serine/threonine protein kinase [Pyrinomonadaceae bacterium]
MKELALAKTRLDGRYEITELLGRGSYAEIYLARDSSAAPASPHSSVVIKALNVFLQDEPDVELERTLIENFQNEAVALDRVRHPNVINRLGHGTARDLRGTIFHYLVLEYLPGGDLMQLCKREPLSLEKTLLYLEQVCAGLAHAHSRGVIHRDIKPQNLLLTRDRQIVKIADFGVARFTNQDAPITRVGTNIYAAPEHSPLNAAIEAAHGQNHARLTPAADVYSLAKTVYALLAGDSPRKFSNAPVTGFPPLLSEKSWAYDVLRVLEHATQSSLEARTKTVNDFWNEIYHAVNETEEATRILKPELLAVAAKSLLNFTAQVPSSPSFNSLPNVQIPTQSLPPELPERPRLVVELGQVKPAAQMPKPFNNPLPIQSNGNGQHLPAAPNGNNKAQKAQTNNPLSQMVKQQASANPSRLAMFFKRLALRFAVVLLLLGVFAGVLAGTVNYLQTSGYLPTSLSIWTTKKAVVNAGGANLRSSAEISDNIIGFVTKGSELKVLGEDGSWYKVEIVRQGQPNNENITRETRGYISKSLVDIQ